MNSTHINFYLVTMIYNAVNNTVLGIPCSNTKLTTAVNIVLTVTQGPLPTGPCRLCKLIEKIYIFGVRHLH